jgi:hypothetical protein
MSLHQEIENAFLRQSADLMSVVSSCNFIVMHSLSDDHPSFVFDHFRESHWALERAEALQAALLNRAGVSWDEMSSRAGGIRSRSIVSRQAMHRRLAALGESNFRESQIYPHLAREAIESTVLTVPLKPSKILKLCAVRANEIMRAKSHPQWWLDSE